MMRTCTYEVACGSNSTSTTLNSDFVSSLSNGMFVFDLAHNENTNVPRSSVQIASSFQVSNGNCPGKKISILPANGFASSDYAHNGVQTYLDSTCGSCSVKLRLPVSTNNLIFTQTFAVKFEAVGGYSFTVEPIKVTSVNCTNFDISDMLDYPTKNIPVTQSYPNFNYTIYQSTAFNLSLPMWNLTQDLDWVCKQCNCKAVTSIQTCSKPPFDSNSFWDLSSGSVKIFSTSLPCSEAERGLCYQIQIPQTSQIQTNVAFQLELQVTNRPHIEDCLSIKLINCQYATWSIPSSVDQETPSGTFLILNSSLSSNYTYTLQKYFGSTSSSGVCQASLAIVPINGGSSADFTFNGFSPEVISTSQASNNLLLNIPLNIGFLSSKQIKFRVSATTGDPNGIFGVSKWVKYSDEIWISITGCSQFNPVSQVAIEKTVVAKSGTQIIINNLQTLFDSVDQDCPRSFDILKTKSPEILSTNVSQTSGIGPVSAVIDTFNLDNGFSYNTPFSVWVKGSGSTGYTAFQELRLTLTANCNKESVLVLKPSRYEIIRSIADPQGISVNSLFASSLSVCPVNQFRLLTDSKTDSNLTLDSLSGEITINSLVPATYDITVQARVSQDDWSASNALDIRIILTCLKEVKKLQSIPTFRETETDSSQPSKVVSVHALFNTSKQFCPLTFKVFADPSLHVPSPNVTIGSETAPSFLLIDRKVSENYDFTQFRVWVEASNGEKQDSSEVKLQILPDCNLKQVITLQVQKSVTLIKGRNRTMSTSNLFKSSLDTYCKVNLYSLHNNDPPANTSFSGTVIGIDSQSGLLSINEMTEGTFVLNVKAKMFGSNPQNFSLLTIRVECDNRVELKDQLVPLFELAIHQAYVQIVDVTTFFNTANTNLCKIATYQLLGSLSPVEQISRNTTLNGTHLQIVTGSINETNIFDVWIKASTQKSAQNYKKVRIKVVEDCNSINKETCFRNSTAQVSQALQHSESVQLQVKKVFKLVKELNKSEEYISMKIKSVDNFGVMTIKFEVNMYDEKAGFNISLINKQTVLIELLQIDSQLIQEKQSIQLSWEVLSFQKDTLTLKVSFPEPKQVSLYSRNSRDQIRLTLLEDYLFRGDDAHKGVQLVDPTVIKYYIKVPKQMENNTEAQIVQTVVNSMDNLVLSAAVSQFTISFFVAFSLSYLIGMFNALQVILYQQMINIEIPVNAVAFNKVFLALLNADILNPEYFQSMLGLDFTSDYIKFDMLTEQNANLHLSWQIYDTGFETYNAILNIGGIFVLLLLYLVQIVYSLLLKRFIKLLQSRREKEKQQAHGEKSTIKRILKKIGPYQERHRHSLYFTQIILIVYESIFPLSVAALLNLYKPEVNLEVKTVSIHYTQIMSQIFGYLNLVLLAFVLVVSIRLLMVPRNILGLKETKRKFFVLYQELSYNRRSSLIYNIMFILRRFAMACIIISYPRGQGCALVYFQFSNLMFLIYQWQVRPQRIKQHKTRENINEVFVLTITTVFILFSDYCDDNFIQFVAGYLYMGLVSLCVMTNMFFSVRRPCKLLFEKLKRFYSLLKAKANLARSMQTFPYADDFLEQGEFDLELKQPHRDNNMIIYNRALEHISENLSNHKRFKKPPLLKTKKKLPTKTDSSKEMPKLTVLSTQQEISVNKSVQNDFQNYSFSSQKELMNVGGSDIFSEMKHLSRRSSQNQSQENKDSDGKESSVDGGKSSYEINKSSGRSLLGSQTSTFFKMSRKQATSFELKNRQPIDKVNRLSVKRSADDEASDYVVQQSLGNIQLASNIQMDLRYLEDFEEDSEITPR